jgi:hypothetical protein
MIMKKLLVVMCLLMSISMYGQTPQFPTTSDKWVQTPQPIIDAMTTRQLREADIQRNANLIILMVNENQIRNINRWRIWHKLKERKRFRIVRRWQKEHGRNNIKPESLRRRHR